MRKCFPSGETFTVELQSAYRSGLASSGCRKDLWVAAEVRHTWESTFDRINPLGRSVTKQHIRGILKGVRPLESAFGYFSHEGKVAPRRRRGGKKKGVF